MGDCPACPEEPLLDLYDEEVVHMLQAFDEQAWRQRMAQVTGVCAVLCSPVLLLGLVIHAFALPVYGVVTLGAAAAVYPFFKARKVTPVDVVGS